MSTKMKMWVQQYIEKCTVKIQENNEAVSKELQEEIISTFDNYISNLEKGLNYDMPDFYGGYHSRAKYTENIKKLKCKLEGYFANDCQDVKLNNNSSGLVLKNENINKNDNINKNENSNNVNINLDILIKNAKKEIEENESMSEDEIQEVLDKITEIEEIGKSNEVKNKKWFKLRPTLDWLGSKGLTVGTTILNLITAILKFQSK